MQYTELPAYVALYSRLCNFNLFGTQYTNHVNLLKDRLNREQAVITLKQSKPPPTANEKYQHLQQIWKQEQYVHSKSFCGGITTRMFCQLWRQYQKTIVFYHDKDIDTLNWSFVVYYENWPNFVYINLQTQNSIPWQRQIKTCWRKFEKMFLEVMLLFLLAKRFLMKISFESLQTYANQLLGLMLAYYIRIRRANPCPWVFIRIRISIQRQVDSDLDKARPVAWKKIVLSYYWRTRPDCKMESFNTLSRRKKLTTSVRVDFDLIATLHLKPRASFITFVPVMKFDRLWLRRLFNVVVRIESSINWDETIYEKKSFIVIEMWVCE